VVQAVRRARELRAKQPEGEEEILVIQADKTLPYKTVYLVLRSCSLAGYTRYRIAVLKE
jgi:biopolymer transport protein ExbD